MSKVKTSFALSQDSRSPKRRAPSVGVVANTAEFDDAQPLRPLLYPV